MIIYKDKQKKINIPQGLGNTKITVTQIMPDCPECPDIECPECDECPELENIKITKNGVYNGAFDRVEVRVEDSDGSYSAGYEDGFDEGFTDGFTDGYADGITDGTEQQKSLLQPISITENGTYQTDNGYSEVNVNVQGGGTNKIMVKDGIKFGNSTYTEIPNIFDFEGVTDLYGMFYNCRYLEKSPDLSNLIASGPTSNMFNNCWYLTDIPYFDSSNVTNMDYMFESCIEIETIPQFITTNVISMVKTFYNCATLQNIPALNVPNLVNTSSIFGALGNDIGIPLKNFGGFIDIKCDFDIKYCPSLTYQSCINVLNGLYDFTGNGETPGSNQGKLKVHQNFLDLVGDEISIGTNKGWNIIEY